jgi:ribosomal protein S18 acetylase RimI-like enzyme
MAGDDSIPDTVPRALVWATDLDVLPLDRVIERHGDHLSVRSPSNPAHYWGNLLLFDDPPVAGDGPRWEQLFEGEIDGSVDGHRTFAWDTTDGSLGAARGEFLPRGYELEQTVGLVGTPDRVRPHPRANREVSVVAVDPAEGADLDLWEQVPRLQAAGRDPRLAEGPYLAFARARQRDLRRLFQAGRGAWYVALAPGGREVVASCGLVVTGGRGRYQAVDTAEAHRRRGISSRLVVAAAHHAAEHFRAEHLVIAADPDYHALGLYESLGFERAERVAGAFRPPPDHRTSARGVA